MSEFGGVTVVRDDAPDAYGGRYQGEALANLLAPVLRDGRFTAKRGASICER